MDVQSVLDVGAILGEGPVWTRDALWFVDIKRHHVHRFDPVTGATARWTAPEQIGWVLPSSDGAMIAGVKTGLFRFDPDSGEFTTLLDPEPEYPNNRLNDGTTDRDGTIWFGSMDDGESAPTGGLYRFADGKCADTALPRVSITNGPAISADGRTLFHTDTLGKRIWRVSINDDGSLGKPHSHITIEHGVGHPDGSVIDAEGCLWIGLFGGWAVRRYDPTGALIDTVRFPVANITKIAFGGPELGTAYATTASKGLDARSLATQPLAGNLFAFEPGVAGLPTIEAKIL